MVKAESGSCGERRLVVKVERVKEQRGREGETLVVKVERRNGGEVGEGGRGMSRAGCEDGRDGSERG